MNRQGSVTALFYVVFFVAGAPALIYQTVWQRVLTLYFGVDIYSTTVTVASVMLGLGLGSLVGGRLADRTTNPLRLYMLAEFLIGICGAASLSVFSRVGAALAGSSLWVVIPTDFLLLLVPTMLMGMTLPLMCRIVTATDAEIGRHLARLYGLNTLGAALGAVLSTYFLCGLFGLDGTTRIAAGINFLVAAMTWGLSRAAVEAPATDAPTEQRVDVSAAAVPSAQQPRETPLSLILSLSFLSGFVALGYEILWYRVLTLLLHGTVYVFGTILCFFLLGIAAGSLLARRRIERNGPLARFAYCQLGISVYTLALFAVLGHLSWIPGLRHLIGASVFTTFHPSPELLTGNITLVTVYSMLDIFFWVTLILGVPTLLMGYGFPNLLRAGSQTVAQLGQSVAAIYFANIIGSTLGTLVVGFVLLHWCGMEITLTAMVILGCLPALLVFYATAQNSAGPGLRSASYWRIATIATIAASVLLLPWPLMLVKSLHYADFDNVDFLAVEDHSGTVVLRRQHQRISFKEEDSILGKYRLYIDGVAHGGYDDHSQVETEPAADWGLAAHRAPNRVLCIGFGDGKTCASALRVPAVEEMVVVELNSALIEALSQTGQGQFVLDSPRTRMIIDDGRRWLLAHPDEMFDAILTWPLHAAQSHSGNLFSVEFFQLLARHLTDDGILFTRSADLYSTPKTLATVFPHVVRGGRGNYVAAKRAFTFDLERIGQTEVEFVDFIEADRDLILENTQEVRLNRDLSPNSEFYMTYPYAWTLQTWGRPSDDHGYQLRGGPRAESLILRD